MFLAILAAIVIGFGMVWTVNEERVLARARRMKKEPPAPVREPGEQ